MQGHQFLRPRYSLGTNVAGINFWSSLIFANDVTSRFAQIPSLRQILVVALYWLSEMRLDSSKNDK